MQTKLIATEAKAPISLVFKGLFHFYKLRLSCDATCLFGTYLYLYCTSSLLGH